MAEQADRRAELLARREASRRASRRRRRLAAGALAISLGAVIALAAVLLGGGDGPTDSGNDWRPHTGPVPILEWHVLGAPGPGVPYPELYVTRHDFSAQMDWLDRQGYEAVTLEQVEDAWWRGGTLPPKPVVLSFDDGYRPQFTFALPELRRHGWAGLLNLKAEGSDLYESNVKKLIAAGWQLASHTIDHSDLTTLP